MIKEKVDNFFDKDLVDGDNIDSLSLDAMEFVEKYDELFSKIKDLSDIKLKQYVINANRNYLYANQNVHGMISYLYDNKKIDSSTLNIIINALIKTNKRNSYNNQVEHIIGLKLYKDFLTYIVISSNYYYLVIEPYPDFNIDFAKIIVNDEEIMASHSHNENGNVLVSQKVEFDNLPDVLNFDFVFKINGEEYTKELGEN